MDGPGFHVDVEVLNSAASSMGAIVHDQSTFALRGLCGDPELYGHRGVHDALAQFCGRWSVGLDALSDRAAELGTSLGKAAEAYRETEHTTTATLTADPGWDTVALDTLPTGII